MTLTTYTLNGKEYHLLLNGSALFDFYDRFGHDAEMAALLSAEDAKAAFEAALWMLAEFSFQGERYRRSQGADRGAYITAAQAALEITPKDIPGLKMALLAAIRAGFVREHKGEQAYDPWLAELNQKKTMGLLAPAISGWLQRYLGSHRARA